jgi:CMP-N-acetylneuraminic acid synthetase
MNYLCNIFVEKARKDYIKKTAIYLMPPERSFDIDTNFDWKLLKFLLKINYNEIYK